MSSNTNNVNETYKFMDDLKNEIKKKVSDAYTKRLNKIALNVFSDDRKGSPIAYTDGFSVSVNQDAVDRLYGDFSLISNKITGIDNKLQGKINAILAKKDSVSSFIKGIISHEMAHNFSENFYSVETLKFIFNSSGVYKKYLNLISHNPNTLCDIKEYNKVFDSLKNEYINYIAKSYYQGNIKKISPIDMEYIETYLKIFAPYTTRKASKYFASMHNALIDIYIENHFPGFFNNKSSKEIKGNLSDCRTIVYGSNSFGDTFFNNIKKFLSLSKEEQKITENPISANDMSFVLQYYIDPRFSDTKIDGNKTARELIREFILANDSYSFFLQEVSDSKKDLFKFIKKDKYNYLDLMDEFHAINEKLDRINTSGDPNNADYDIQVKNFIDSSRATKIILELCSIFSADSDLLNKISSHIKKCIDMIKKLLNDIEQRNAGIDDVLANNAKNMNSTFPDKTKTVDDYIKELDTWNPKELVDIVDIDNIKRILDSLRVSMDPFSMSPQDDDISDEEYPFKIDPSSMQPQPNQQQQNQQQQNQQQQQGQQGQNQQNQSQQGQGQGQGQNQQQQGQDQQQQQGSGKGQDQEQEQGQGKDQQESKDQGKDNQGQGKDQQGQEQDKKGQGQQGKDEEQQQGQDEGLDKQDKGQSQGKDESQQDQGQGKDEGQDKEEGKDKSQEEGQDKGQSQSEGKEEGKDKSEGQDQENKQKSADNNKQQPQQNQSDNNQNGINRQSGSDDDMQQSSDSSKNISNRELNKSSKSLQDLVDERRKKQEAFDKASKNLDFDENDMSDDDLLHNKDLSDELQKGLEDLRKSMDEVKKEVAKQKNMSEQDINDLNGITREASNIEDVQEEILKEQNSDSNTRKMLQNSEDYLPKNSFDLYIEELYNMLSKLSNYRPTGNRNPTYISPYQGRDMLNDALFKGRLYSDEFKKTNVGLKINVVIDCSGSMCSNFDNTGGRKISTLDAVLMSTKSLLSRIVTLPKCKINVLTYGIGYGNDVNKILEFETGEANSSDNYFKRLQSKECKAFSKKLDTALSTLYANGGTYNEDALLAIEKDNIVSALSKDDIKSDMNIFFTDGDFSVPDASNGLYERTFKKFEDKLFVFCFNSGFGMGGDLYKHMCDEFKKIWKDESIEKSFANVQNPNDLKKALKSFVERFVRFSEIAIKNQNKDFDFSGLDMR